MPTWDTDQYLKFAAERTQPAIDLASRIAVENPARIVDLGCGPGTSTAVLARRWPSANITGIDNSPAMLAAAKATFPAVAWELGDIATWTSSVPVDVVFANASLQWIPDHANLLPRLFNQVSANGALAFQVPANFDAAPHRLMRELATSRTWRDSFRAPVREWHAHEPGSYYDVLARLASRVELWTTDYIHPLRGPEEIVQWYRGTGLRPWLDVLENEQERARFLDDYLAAITSAFTRCQDGRVLFPFRRLFVVAHG